MTVLENLVGAKRLLIERGWIKCGFESPEGFCAMGALKMVNSDYDSRYAAYKTLYEALRISSIGDWNDKQESVDSVLAGFDKAIELARSRACLPQ